MRWRLWRRLILSLGWARVAYHRRSLAIRIQSPLSIEKEKMFGSHACITCLLGLVVMTTGCATVARGPAYSESKAVAIKADEALVFIFRENAQPENWWATIHIDNKEVCALNQGRYTWVYVKPGKKGIKALWSGMSGQRDSYILLDMSAGKTYYLDLTGILQPAGATLMHRHYRVGSSLGVVTPEAAEARLAKCCTFQKPLGTDY